MEFWIKINCDAELILQALDCYPVFKATIKSQILNESFSVERFFFFFRNRFLPLQSLYKSLFIFFSFSFRISYSGVSFNRCCQYQMKQSLNNIHQATAVLAQYFFLKKTVFFTKTQNSFLSISSTTNAVGTYAEKYKWFHVGQMRTLLIDKLPNLRKALAQLVSEFWIFRYFLASQSSSHSHSIKLGIRVDLFLFISQLIFHWIIDLCVWNIVQA